MSRIHFLMTTAAVLSALAFATPASATGWGDDDDIVYIAKRLDASAANPATNNAWFGAGNSIDNFVQTQNRSGELELGLKVKYRTGFDILPTYLDDDELVVEVPTGPQVIDPARGVSSARPDRAAWSVDFSVNTGVGPRADTLANYDVTLTFDLDPTGRERKPLRLTMFRGNTSPAAGVSGYQWKADNGTVVIGDDGGTDRVTQNSFNYAFIASLIDTDRSTPGIQPYAFGPANFTVELSAKPKFGFGYGSGRTELEYTVSVKP